MIAVLNRISAYTILFLLFVHAQSQITYNWNTFTTDNSILQTSIITRLLFLNDTLWVGTDKGLYFFANEVLKKENSFPDYFIKSFEKGAQGSFWIGTGCNGIFHRRSNGQFVSYYSGNTGGSGLLNDCILSLASGNDSLWVGTEGSGVYLFYNNTWQSYHSGNVPGSPDMNHVLDVETTPGNTLWLATASSGMMKKSGSLWVIYDSLFGLPSNRVHCIMPENDTLFWLGLGGGNAGSHLVKMDIKNEIILQTFDTALSNGISHDNIWQIFIDSRQRKWIGPNNGITGLTVYNDTSFYAYDEFEAGLKSLLIYDFAEDDSNRIWAATFRGLSVNTTVFGLHVEEMQLSDHPLLYPNPVQAGMPFFIKTTEDWPKIQKISIYDITGRMMYDDLYSESGFMIPTNTAPGYYVVVIRNQQQRYVFKLLVFE